jgi:rSAM/selenodomain-associated transferase 1
VSSQKTGRLALHVQVLVLAKSPRPGFVKTRLCPPFTAGEAAQIATAALRDTFRAVAAAPVARRVLVLEGAANGVDIPDGFDVVAQRGYGLDERIANAFDDGFRLAPMPQILVGMDTPQLHAALLADAATTLLRPLVDAVIGPTDDGGYWLLGLRVPRRTLIVGVETSVPWTHAMQRRRFDEAGLRVASMPQLRDVDRADDAAAVAALAPRTAFAATIRNISAATAIALDDAS